MRNPIFTCKQKMCRAFLAFTLAMGTWVVGSLAIAQAPTFDAGWYQNQYPFIKIGVVHDGVYAVSREMLTRAGVPLSSLDRATLQLFYQGQEIPLYVPAAPTSLDVTFAFVGHRNTGREEAWLYNKDHSFQSSTHYSFFSDTTHYWLTWGNAIGKRYQPAVATGSPQRLTTTRDTIHLEGDARYYHGTSFDVRNPLYTRGEGFYWHLLRPRNQGAASQGYTFSGLQPVSDPNQTFTLQAHVLSQTNSQHRVVLSLELRQTDGTLAFTPVDTLEWAGSGLMQTLSAKLPQHVLPHTGSLRAQVVAEDRGAFLPSDILVDWLELTYERTLDATSNNLMFAIDMPGTYRIDIAGTVPGGLILNEQEGTFVEMTSDGTFSFTETISTPSSYWLVQNSSMLVPASVQRDQPSDWANAANAFDYVILATPALAASAQHLADYRASPEGGGYNTTVVYVQDIFDQFDYGRPTPVAIRRFLHQAQSWAKAPQFLIIWGDALYPDRSRPRQAWEIPSYGNTASDGWFGMHSAGFDDWREIAAIGRIPARTNEAGNLFVEKIRRYESRPLDSWQKRAMFLVGGKSTSEKAILQSATLNWSNLATTTPAALDTLHFFKDSSAPLDPTFADTLRTSIKDGAAWLNYFGHSALNIWEIVTDPPREFDNADRLPVVMSLGCFTGDFAVGSGAEDDALSMSELLVLDSFSGSIAHWGASSSGSISASARLSDQIHQSVFQDTLRTLGLAFQQAKGRFSEANTDANSIKHLLQYGLVGDPATRLILPTKPDLRVEASDLTINPIAPVPADSQIAVTVPLENLGLLPTDSVTVQLIHEQPSSPPTVYSQRIAPPRFRSSATFIVPINDGSVGENRLRAQLDPLNVLAEADETNNEAQQSVTVFKEGVTIIDPINVGLVNTTTPSLNINLTTTDLDSGVPLVFQLDTTPTFDSPDLQEQAETATSSFVSWQPTGLQAGQTYYWRVRIDNPNEPENWSDASFTIRTDLGTQGWLQTGSLFDQNQQSGFLERTPTDWQLKTFNIDVSVSSERGSGLFKGQFVVSGNVYERVGLGFGLLVLDQFTGEVKGSGSFMTYPNFRNEDPDANFAKLDSLLASANDGDYLYFRTRHLGKTGGANDIQDEIKALLRRQGSTAIDTLTYRDLWIMMTRKGQPAVAQEWVVSSLVDENEIVQETQVPIRFESGTTTTPRIGPAQTWTTLGWTTSDLNETGVVHVDVLAADGETILLTNADTASPLSLAPINPSEHPYLRLRAVLTDSSRRSTPQLESWYIGYEPVAELALSDLSLSADTLQEGQDLTLTTTLSSLNTTRADSVLLTYQLIDGSNNVIATQQDTLFDVSEATTATTTFSTIGLSGRHRLIVRATQPNRDESITFNNVRLGSVTIFNDQTPPRLEVYVENEMLPNDPNPVVNLQDPALPFVSSQPIIDILIEDENPFFSLREDTTVISVTLNDRLIPYRAFDIVEGPSKRGDDNEINLRFQPDLSAVDSTHTLVVQAQDVSGNAAADGAYQVHFRTQSDVALESVYPYPNPMSTQTVFAFRLRGADASLLDDFRLRLYTLSGRLIREFDLLEDPTDLAGGTLRIGWNKLRWDGRDEDGDRVATGVYLYKIFARAEGKTLTAGNTSSVEKVVVIR